MEEKKTSIVKALIKARKSCGKVIKDATGQAGRGRFDYASINSIIEAIEESLSESGLFLSQRVSENQLFTTIHHIDGETMDFGTIPLMGVGDMKTLGSAITYARRYAIQAALMLSASEKEDLDQNQASTTSYDYPTIGKRLLDFSENTKNYLRGFLEKHEKGEKRTAAYHAQLRIIHNLSYDENRIVKRIQDANNK
ncbi:hypothetical protein LCGC14_2445230 [marine sediment metagenome]|uniref:Essential recombination function protein n=1 Tax=marine sediment metagenome TaxID=412755 RepID=A0A0F9BHW2_9ZZZZ